MCRPPPTFTPNNDIKSSNSHLLLLFSQPSTIYNFHTQTTYFWLGKLSLLPASQRNTPNLTETRASQEHISTLGFLLRWKSRNRRLQQEAMLWHRVRTFRPGRVDHRWLHQRYRGGIIQCWNFRLLNLRVNSGRHQAFVGTQEVYKCQLEHIFKSSLIVPAGWFEGVRNKLYRIFF